MKPIVVSAGPVKATYNGIDGWSVATVRRTYKHELQLNFQHIVPVLNGKRTSWNRRLKAGDILSFIQTHGDIA